ncbi:Proline/sodium symporter PutP (TC 2.A.21.2.1) @ Propionate/sodium symporter [hydrothermal vent metagenome]|uniref:Proline/sodium symporter PutP (TC 2.A.21.2.1) @ Propionate/sodium symporter n=1 Tax=hydrothermal vent metagenome TaxID=652676 RepID=A0A1W1EFV8_9ZZZZ
METPVIISFVIYMVAMVAIGLYFYFKTDDLSDYVLGGRGLGPGVTALSAGASDMSGWLLLGLPGMMYTGGLSGAWIVIGLYLGAYLNWLYVAKPLRVYTEKLDDAITIPNYLSKRFEDNKHILQVLTALVILLFYTLYASSGLVGGAKLFEATFGLSYDMALIVGTLVIVSYTFLGGYNAVSWTDFIQGILMMLALIVTPLVVMQNDGGFWNTIETVKGIDPNHLSMFAGTTVIGAVSLFAWGLGYFGQPHILVRFMSIKKSEDMKIARRIGMAWMGLAIVGALSVGFFGMAYVASHGIELNDPEKIFIVLTQLLFNPWIAGFLLAAILAAIMSTIDSQLLVSSSALTRDIYQAVLRKEASDTELVWMGRGTVILIALIAFSISMDPNSSVLSLVSYAWAGFGAAFGPLIILSLYHKTINLTGAIAGIVVGTATVLIWKPLSGGLFDLYELLPGFVFAWIAILVFSKIGKPLSSKSLETFNEVEADLKK